MRTLEEDLILGSISDLFCSSDLEKILKVTAIEDIKGVNLTHIYREVEQELGYPRTPRRLRFLVREIEKYLGELIPKDKKRALIRLEKQGEQTQKRIRRAI